MKCLTLAVTKERMLLTTSKSNCFASVLWVLSCVILEMFAGEKHTTLVVVVVSVTVVSCVVAKQQECTSTSCK